MQAVIQPSVLAGEVHAPASKSSMQRACAAALVGKVKSTLKNPGHSDDDKAALAIITTMGCEVTMTQDECMIDSRMSPINTRLYPSGFKPQVDCGESGLAIRMFTPILSLSKREILISGKGSLLHRPMEFFDRVLPQLGVEIISNNGRLPLRIKGPLEPKNITIDGSLSSQFLTGLLFAYAGSKADGVVIKVTNLRSKPYINLTLKVMRDFGLPVPENKNYEEFCFQNEPVAVNPSGQVIYAVESDWSGGAFLLVAGAIAGDIVVKGLDMNSTQADKLIVEALIASGCKMNTDNNTFSFANAGNEDLAPFYFDATDCPDLFPPLVALASYCVGVTSIKGVNRLIHKESNRAHTLQEEFGKLGVRIMLEEDIMVINGNRRIRGATVHSHYDHRIAMACAVAGLQAQDEVTIDHAESVNKSYPEFYQHLQSLGAIIRISELINQ